MPFDEENEDIQISKKIGIKNVSSKKSIFDDMPKKPTQEEHTAKVKKIVESTNANKIKASELISQFNKQIADKTLPQNKNMFQNELEKELLMNLLQLAIDINGDPNENDDMGTLSLITTLFKTCFSQRDRINKLEYSLLQLEKKLNSNFINDLVSKEINKALDKK